MSHETPGFDDKKMRLSAEEQENLPENERRMEAERQAFLDEAQRKNVLANKEGVLNRPERINNLAKDSLRDDALAENLQRANVANRLATQQEAIENTRKNLEAAYDLMNEAEGNPNRRTKEI